VTLGVGQSTMSSWITEFPEAPIPPTTRSIAFRRSFRWSYEPSAKQTVNMDCVLFEAVNVGSRNLWIMLDPGGRGRPWSSVGSKVSLYGP
jgi:hypothetical protein